MGSRRALAIAIFAIGTVSLITGPATANEQAGGITWRAWSADLFKQAKAENRFVILDLEAVWCHWCHVMEKTTYADPKVTKLLGDKYITVRVDQDANPDLSSRYGDWGWPATIIFAPDGSELVKRAGYIEPENMVALLEAVIADPTPGPSVAAEQKIEPATSPFLSAEQRADLKARSIELFDQEHGGWGTVHRFIDTDSMDWELTLAAANDKDAAVRAEKTFQSALKLIDPVEGGIYQYSDELDWSSPHYEKIMWYQANGLRQFSEAYLRWRDPRTLEAAGAIKKYLLTVLHSPDGAFFASQDADASEAMPGKVYYALDQNARDALAQKPRIDRHVYARENGWAIRGLVAFFAATGDRQALEAAVTAAKWVLANRRLDGGGFRHDEKDRAGPYLGDTLAMGHAALDLYAATGDRQWLTIAGEAGDFIAAKFKDEVGGFPTSVTAEADTGVFAKPAKVIDEQVQVARFANLLHRYCGNEKYRELAEHAARYLAAKDVIDLPRAYPGVLLVDAELGHEPTHMTIVGHKDNPKSAALLAAALAYPDGYRRIDWWDKREGGLANPDVQYPELDEPAAFACTDRICSLPVFEPSELAGTVGRMVKRTAEDRSR